MKALMNFCIFGMLTLVSSGYALAQAATSAEARLKELNITLPPLRPPVANYVDSVRVGNLLFLLEILRLPIGSTKAKWARTLRCKKATTRLGKLG